jgi:flagellar motor component MotA
MKEFLLNLSKQYAKKSIKEKFLDLSSDFLTLIFPVVLILLSILGLYDHFFPLKDAIKMILLQCSIPLSVGISLISYSLTKNAYKNAIQKRKDKVAKALDDNKELWFDKLFQLELIRQYRNEDGIKITDEEFEDDILAIQNKKVQFLTYYELTELLLNKNKLNSYISENNKLFNLSNEELIEQINAVIQKEIQEHEEKHEVIGKYVNSKKTSDKIFNKNKNLALKL